MTAPDSHPVAKHDELFATAYACTQWGFGHLLHQSIAQDGSAVPCTDISRYLEIVIATRDQAEEQRQQIQGAFDE